MIPNIRHPSTFISQIYKSIRTTNSTTGRISSEECYQNFAWLKMLLLISNFPSQEVRSNSEELYVLDCKTAPRLEQPKWECFYHNHLESNIYVRGQNRLIACRTRCGTQKQLLTLEKLITGKLQKKYLTFFCRHAKRLN